MQRRFRRWKLTHGHDRKPVYFEQEHEPGRMLQLDWFHPRDFEVRIAGEAYRHLICHCVLTYSNWEWATVCRSESFASLKACLQAAVWELGGVPQAGSSPSPPHRLGREGVTSEPVAWTSAHVQPTHASRGCQTVAALDSAANV